MPNFVGFHVFEGDRCTFCGCSFEDRDSQCPGPEPALPLRPGNVTGFHEFFGGTCVHCGRAEAACLEPCSGPPLRGTAEWRALIELSERVRNGTQMPSTDRADSIVKSSRSTSDSNRDTAGLDSPQRQTKEGRSNTLVTQRLLPVPMTDKIAQCPICGNQVPFSARVGEVANSRDAQGCVGGVMVIVGLLLLPFFGIGLIPIGIGIWMYFRTPRETVYCDHCGRSFEAKMH